MEPEPQPTKAGWSVWDPLLIFLLGLIVATIASVVAGALGYIDLELLRELGSEGELGDRAAEELPKVLAVSVPVQALVMLAGIRLMSRRKGTGDLRHDFHLTYKEGDWVALFYGAGLLLAAALLLAGLFRALGIDPPTQQVVEGAEEAERIAEKLVIALFIGLVAPVVEELLFRGMLFDALLRRNSVTRTIWISGAVFGLVHLVDPASYALVPALIGLGVILGYVRRNSGSLSQPILMHVGFNSVTAIALFVGA